MRKNQFIDKYVKWIKLRLERSEWTNTNENIISNKRKVKASLCVISHRCWATPVQWASAGSRGAKARFPAELCRGADLRTASLSTSAGSLWTAWCLSARYGMKGVVSRILIWEITRLNFFNQKIRFIFNGSLVCKDIDSWYKAIFFPFPQHDIYKIQFLFLTAVTMLLWKDTALW